MKIEIETVYENYFWGNKKIVMHKITPVGRNEKEYTLKEWVDIKLMKSKKDKKGSWKWR